MIRGNQWISLGITKWLQPSDITRYVNSGRSIPEAVDEFIQEQLSVYQDSPANGFNIIKNLQASKEEPQIFMNNTVAFFFNEKNEFLHGARYVTTFLNNIAIGAWTSKMGQSILISHDLSDLMGQYSIYGNNLTYAISVIGDDIEEKDYL